MLFQFFRSVRSLFTVFICAVLSFTLSQALFKQGYEEVKDCSGTGLGPCRFEFTNQAGEMLVVSTISQGQTGPDRFVWRWFIEPGGTDGSIGKAKG
jgi:hypothetical protein